MATATTATNGHKKARVRSPAYPSIDLETAVERVRTIYQHETRSAAPVSVVVSHCGVDIKSSSGLRLLSALKQFGLTEDEGSGDDRRMKLSELALDILLAPDVDDTTRALALKRAAINPKMHRALWDEYRGELPSDPNMRAYLIRKHDFNDASTGQFIREFRATIKFANLSASDIIKDDVGDDSSDTEGERMDNTGRHVQDQKRPEHAPSTVGQRAAAGLPSGATVRIPVTLPTLKVAWLEIPVPLTGQEYDTLASALQSFKQALTTPQPMTATSPRPEPQP